MKYLIWLLAILFVVVVVLIVTGWGDKGYNYAKKALEKKQDVENAKMKTKIAILEEENTALILRINEIDKEITNVNKRLVDSQKVIKDLRLKLAQVTVPSDPDAIVQEYRALGYKSFGRKR